MGLSFLLNSPENTPRFAQYDLNPAAGTEAHREALIGGFMFLQVFGGHFGIPLVLLTAAFSKKVQRHPMLINFCVCWFIYATSFTLLLYSGTQIGPEPPLQLCIIQASFIYGTPVMTSMAGLAFVIHLWFSLKTGASQQAQRLRSFLLLISPYVLFLGFTVAMVILGSFNPETVSRSRYLFYCTINLPVVNAVPGTSAIIMAMVCVFEVLIGIKLYRHHKAFKGMSRTASNGPPLHLFIRVGIFSAYSLLALVACIAFWSSSGDNLPYIIQASLPTAAFLIFGTQGDILRVWGITAAARFISRPFVRRSPAPEKVPAAILNPVPRPMPVVYPIRPLRRHETVNTMATIPPDVPEKDSIYNLRNSTDTAIQMV
ncbi:hypothetical protein C8R46DRAFT_1103412 [Mycena filopes]|nr:hypothetical protein C8R46DRAFT_1103412 [Mycena filopes]